MTKLFILTGPKEGQSFELEKDEISIGRSSSNHIQLPYNSVSRIHAKITRKDDQFFIEDLKSQNGTWVQGRPIQTGVPIGLEEKVPVALGNVIISLGIEEPEKGLITQYSINLSQRFGETWKDFVYKDARVTNRKDLELIYQVATTVMESLDIKQICEKVMDAIFSSMVRIDEGIVLLLNRKTNKLNKIISRSRLKKKTSKVKLRNFIIKIF